MSNYLIHSPERGVLCKPPRVGDAAYWEAPLRVAYLRFPWIVGVMVFDTESNALALAATFGGVVKPVTEVFDASVILSPP